MNPPRPAPAVSAVGMDPEAAKARPATLNLLIPEDRHAALRRHPLLAKSTPAGRQTLTSIYYDTARFDLRRAGLVFRLRRADESWVQSLSRQETSDAASFLHPVWQAPYLNHFDLSTVGEPELRDWLLKQKISRRMVPQFETRFRRLQWRVERHDREGVLIRLDRGWIAADGRREAVSELQLELRTGSIDELHELALELGATLPLAPLLLSKAERGYRLVRNTVMRPVRAGAVEIAGAASPHDAFRRIALDCLTHLQLNHAGAIAGSDPEYVHQMRVATRRLRAALRMFRPVLPPAFEAELAPGLRDLMRGLGLVRDLDVLMDEIVSPVCRAVPDEPRLTELAGAITNRLYVAREEVRRMLRDPAYGRLLLSARRLLHQAPFAGAADDPGADQLAAFADRRLRRFLKRIIELAGTARPDYPPSLHELRIAIKRLRYAVEFFGELLPGKGGTSLQKRLAGLQEDFGQLNDLASAGTLLMVCAGRESQLREAVTLIGGWHGPRHAALLESIPERLDEIRKLRLERLKRKDG